MKEEEKCSYCNPENIHYFYERQNMCAECKESYDEYLLEKGVVSNEK